MTGLIHYFWNLDKRKVEFWSLMPIQKPFSVTNNSVGTRMATVSQVGHNSSTHVACSGRSRTNAVICSWNGHQSHHDWSHDHGSWIRMMMILLEMIKNALRSSLRCDLSPSSISHRWRYFKFSFRATRDLETKGHQGFAKRSERIILWWIKDIWKLWRWYFGWGAENGVSILS